MSDWIPFGSARESYEVLVDGTPEWLLPSLRDWFTGQFTTRVQRNNAFGGTYTTDGPDVPRMRRADLAVRGEAWSDRLGQLSLASVFAAMTANQRLIYLDWLVRDNSAQGRPNDALEDVLSAGGSKWRVGDRDGLAGLEQRVPEGVQLAADRAMSTEGDAGRLLAQAWRALYGQVQQADLAYRKAIEAVEAVVLPRVVPNDQTAHLGKAISQMRADGNWSLPFVKEHRENPSSGVVLGMLQALWSGHSDRHPGTSNYIQSTPEAAETALSLAVTLINTFASGNVARRPVR